MYLLELSNIPASFVNAKAPKREAPSLAVAATIFELRFDFQVSDFEFPLSICEFPVSAFPQFGTRGRNLEAYLLILKGIPASFVCRNILFARPS